MMRNYMEGLVGDHVSPGGTEERMEKLPANISHNLNFEASVGVSTMSLLTFIVLSLLLVFYYRGDDQVKGMGSPNNLVLIFLGILISTVTSLCIPSYDEDIYKVYIIILLLWIGIFVTALGAFYFFAHPKENERPIAYHHENMSLLVWVVTIPLVVMETLEFIGSLTVELQIYKAALIISALSQKLIQASVYHFSLRHKVPRKDKKQGASWYLRVISLFNYSMWLHTMMSSKEQTVEQMFGKGISIVSNAMIALLIDYRLLCCMIFAEHSMDMDKKCSHQCCSDTPQDKVLIVENVTKFNICSSQMSGLGYVFGFIMISLQLICGLQNFDLVGSWTNVFAIVADVFVGVLGFQLLNQDTSRKTPGVYRKRKAKGIDMMVALMGITGLVFWIIMTIFQGSWVYELDILTDNQVSYLLWSCVKNVFRAVGIIFQLYIFFKCDAFFGCRDSVKRKLAPYFLFPALMFTLLSIFVMGVMDGQNKLIEELTLSSGVDNVLGAVMKVSEPLYLGFCLHLFLHFFIAYNNVKALQPQVFVANGQLDMNPLV